MPSGTSLSSESTSSCAYRSLEYERASPRDCIAPIDPCPGRPCTACRPRRSARPGDSATPASSDPSITVSAPTAIGLRDIAGLLQAAVADDRARPAGRQAFAASWIAVTCGTPMPVTTRVVQIEPGPTPTLTASAPASTSACAPARVAMLPPTISTREPTSRSQPRHHLDHALRVPVRGVDHDHVDAGVDQRHRPLVRLLADADRGAAEQPPVGVLGGHAGTARS